MYPSTYSKAEYDERHLGLARERFLERFLITLVTGLAIIFAGIAIYANMTASDIRVKAANMASDPLGAYIKLIE